MAEVVAFEQQRLADTLRQCVGEAVAEVQLRWVAAAPTEVPVRGPGPPELARP